MIYEIFIPILLMSYGYRIRHSIKFSAEARKAFYTTNAIESLNLSYRRLNRQRSVFPSPQSLLKALYLATFEATKKMDDAAAELGKSKGRIIDHVPRQADGLAWSDSLAV